MKLVYYRLKFDFVFFLSFLFFAFCGTKQELKSQNSKLKKIQTEKMIQYHSLDWVATLFAPFPKIPNSKIVLLQIIINEQKEIIFPNKPLITSISLFITQIKNQPPLPLYPHFSLTLSLCRFFFLLFFLLWLTCAPTILSFPTTSIIFFWRSLRENFIKKN